MSLSPLTILLITTYISSLTFLHYGRGFAYKMGWYDTPGGRKQHRRRTPLHGGFAMFLSLSFSLLYFTQSSPEFMSVILSSLILVSVGIIDDFKPINAKIRLIIQWVAAFNICYFGQVTLDSFGNLFGFGDIQFWPFLLPFITSITIVGVINAINMIDGLDGLAGSLTLQIFLWLISLVILNQNQTFLLLLGPCIAMMIAYLRFNFRWSKHAKVFMGDGGSMLLGLLIAFFTITFSQAPYSFAPPALFLWIVAMPLYDTGNVMWCRFKQKKHLFSPDRQHLHHVIQDLGISGKITVLLMNFIAAGIASIGFAIHYVLKLPELILFSSFVSGFFLFTYIIGYIQKQHRPSH